MWGGVFGLTHVENDRWGGLPLTLILATFGIAFAFPFGLLLALGRRRSEEHTSELQSLMRISYAVFCLKKKNSTIRESSLPQYHLHENYDIHQTLTARYTLSDSRR